MIKSPTLFVLALLTIAANAYAAPDRSKLHHDQAEARFGFGLANIGDVNDDGLPDFAIGAHNYSDGELEEGSVFVYHGTTGSAPSTPDWTYESDVAGARLGASIAAGDFNGDGINDLAVGAFGYDDGTDDGGAVFVFFGTASGLPAIPDQTLHQAQADAAFGRGLAAADLDNDGFSDLAVGAPKFDGITTDAGRAHVFYGGPTGATSPPDWTVEGSGLEEQFGFELAALGDVNGDSIDDLAVTSRDGGTAVRDGHAEIFHGNAMGISTTPSTELELDAFEARTGFAGLAGGDFNNDGYDDAALGAHTYNTADQPGGVVAVFDGGPDGLSPFPGILIDGGQADAQFGIAVAAGDLSGDGIDDLAVGAQAYPEDGQPSGASFVYFGSDSGIDGSPEYTFTYGQPDAKAGRRVALLSDLDGDGTLELAVTALQYTEDETNEGAVFIHAGFSDFLFSDRFEVLAD